MAYEMFAQHFMQDAWASGHMWKRFGYPRLAQFPTTVELSPGAEARLSKRAIAVVMPDEDEAEPVEPETEASEPVGENRR